MPLTVFRSLKSKHRILAAAAAAVIVAGLVVLSAAVDWRALRMMMETMDRGPLVVLVAVLPLFGFSIGISYLVIGAVFGGMPGMAVVGGITAIHLVGSHWIARSFMRGPLQRYLNRRGKKLPELPKGEEWAVALMTALVPGLPYFVRNYLLALSDIPLRIYFFVCWPVYVIRSSLVIFLGDFSGDISAQRVGLLAGVLVVKVGICAYLLHRLRVRYKAGGGRRGSSPTKKRAA
ncbi:MAG TPA: hypothetical protein VHN79_11550 [Lacunisphaera sp.]|nr:hypothetical protein [Lacunisphaera sp.]